MSTRVREDDEGGEKRTSVKTDTDFKRTNRWSSLKEMKEYLRSEFEKKVRVFDMHGGETNLHFAAYLNDVVPRKCY